jgi:hypothetical protein
MHGGRLNHTERRAALQTFDLRDHVLVHFEQVHIVRGETGHESELF